MEIDSDDPDDTPLPTSEEALSQLWALRHLPEQIAKQQEALDGYIGQLERCTAQVENWVPAINRCVADLDEATQRQSLLEGELGRFFKSEWPQLTLALSEFRVSIKDLGDRMTKLETSMTHVGDKQSTQARELDDLDTRVKALESDKRDKTVVVAERRKWFSMARAGAAVALLVAGFLIAHARDIYQALTK